MEIKVLLGLYDMLAKAGIQEMASHDQSPFFPTFNVIIAYSHCTYFNPIRYVVDDPELWNIISYSFHSVAISIVKKVAYLMRLLHI